MIDADMGLGCFLVFMAAQAAYLIMVGRHDDILHCDPSRWRSFRIDIAAGVMASDAAVIIVGMGGQDIRPAEY